VQDGFEPNPCHVPSGTRQGSAGKDAAKSPSLKKASFSMRSATTTTPEGRWHLLGFFAWRAFVLACCVGESVAPV
jgi:hypothetical protein